MLCLGDSAVPWYSVLPTKLGNPLWLFPPSSSAANSPPLTPNVLLGPQNRAVLPLLLPKQPVGKTHYFPPNHIDRLRNNLCTGCLWRHALEWRTVNPNKGQSGEEMMTGVCLGSNIHREGGVGSERRGAPGASKLFCRFKWRTKDHCLCFTERGQEAPALGTEEESVGEHGEGGAPTTQIHSCATHH